MVRRTDPKEDDWQHVQDPKKRKAIQDRLAQRARRQRLRAGKDQTTQQTTTTTTITTTSRQCNCHPIAHTPIQDVHAPHPISTLDADIDSALALSPTHPILSLLDNDNMAIDFTTPLPINSTPYLLSPQPPLQPALTIYTALYLNGLTLSLTCTSCLHTPSPPAQPSHPLTLHPTSMQLSIPHPRWFDRLPFPRMRDNLIRLMDMGVFDEEEFVRDLFTMESWRIETGGVGWRESAWDTRGWRMEVGWEGKWGWLM